MKYIDAEKLSTQIEKIFPDSSDERTVEGFEYALDKVKAIIDSLQQEHPEKTLTFDGFVDKVGTWFANLRLNKFRKTFNGEIFPATQLVQEYDLFVRELSKTYSDKQEQPEVDLGKEFDDYLESVRAFEKDDYVIEYKNGDAFNHSYDIFPLARHFYELGLKRKEENK